MKQYLNLVSKIQNHGVDRGDRTGTGTRSLFGQQMTFNLEHEFPMINAKRTWWKGVVHELLWLLSGSTNIKYLTDNNVHIWDEWADKNGDLGPVYGKQWRRWLTIDEENSNEFGDGTTAFKTIDQISEAINLIKTNPESRRIIVNAWNVGEISQMALPPCHMFFQFYVAHGKLSCLLYQRSADMFLGVPFNIASYALLTRMIAQVTGLKCGEFIHCIGDAHIYNNHFDQVNQMLNRDIKPQTSMVLLNPSITNIDDFKFEDINLTGYNPHPTIKAKVSV